MIGKAGSNLKTLQEKTGAKLNVPKGEEFVLISGDRAAVENARLQVKAFLDEKVEIFLSFFLSFFLLQILENFFIKIFFLKIF